MTKVLIIEDEVVIADLLSNHLTEQGFEISGVADSMADALEIAQRCAPDLAVVDIRLAHGDDGREVARRLRALPRAAGDRRLGILYASADGEGLLDGGGDACLRKPYRLEDMVQALDVVDRLATGRSLPEILPQRLALLSN